MPAACGPNAACLKAPTTNLTKNEGDTFTWQGNWSVYAPFTMFCRKPKANIYAQYNKNGLTGWWNCTSSSDIQVISGTNPSSKLSCGNNLSCASCTLNVLTLTLKCKVGASGGNYYDIRCYATNAYGTAVSASKRITVNAPVVAAGGNFRLTLMGTT